MTFKSGILYNIAVMCQLANFNEVDSWLIRRSGRQPGEETVFEYASLFPTG